MNEAYPVVVETATIPPVTSPRLLDQVRGILRAKHYSYRTEQAYVHWIRRFILFHCKRHPREMGTAEIERFLTDLAVKGNVSASTQTQALCSLLFLYQHVLKIKLGTLDAVRAKRPKRWARYWRFFRDQRSRLYGGAAGGGDVGSAFSTPVIRRADRSNVK